MESWKKVLEDGILPQMTDAQILAVITAIKTDDPKLIQGSTCVPPPLNCIRDWPCEAACFMSYAGWQDGTQEKLTVAQVVDFFAEMCFKCDRLIGEPAGCRWFLNWWDETPRETVFQLILPVLEEELQNRCPISSC